MGAPVTDTFVVAALSILVVTALGLFVVLRAELAVERMMAVQLLGTGGTAAVLLLGAASGTPAMTDLALLLMLFAAFSSAAFALGLPGEDGAEAGRPEDKA
jgi:multicomponent Na+:H+ antiporter subunit F